VFVTAQLNPRPCVTFRNTLAFYDEWLFAGCPAPQIGGMSTTAYYGIYASGGRIQRIYPDIQRIYRGDKGPLKI
jgi:hypothetical protein